MRAQVHDRGQMTLPKEVRKALHVESGDDVYFTIGDDGSVTLRGMTSIPTDQAWFWTPQWQAGEAEASADIADGSVTVYDTDDDFLASF